MAQLEHVNVTVADPKGLAGLLCDLFDWHIRWEGDGMDGAGYTLHVGAEDSYLALYTSKTDRPGKIQGSTYAQVAGLNHIGIVVDDLEGMADKVRSAGLMPGDHHNYEPGQRFYFDTPHGIEIEVISYA